MTEEEAKTKRCCGPEGCGGGSGHCIGSACMAWRRLPRPEYDPDVQRKYHGSSLQDIEGMNLSAGYCGLAGKP